MGVLAIVAVLGLKTAVLCSLPAAIMPVAAGFAALSGRCVIVLYIRISRYARENGLGQIMFRRQSWLVCLWTVVLWGAVAWRVGGHYGIVVMAAVVIFAFLWMFFTRARIGGATGDTIGACEELTEMLVPLLLLLVLRIR